MKSGGSKVVKKEPLGLKTAYNYTEFIGAKTVSEGLSEGLEHVFNHNGFSQSLGVRTRDKQARF